MPGLLTEKTIINGTKYEVTRLPYKLGHRLLLRLVKAVGPALGQALIDGTGGIGSFGVLLNAQVGPALGAATRTFCETLSIDDFDFAVDELATYTQISKEDGKWSPLKDAMEFHYSGNYVELFQWIGFALKVNYGGFTGEQGFGALLAKIRAASASLKTSIGTFTASQARTATPVA